jgi:ATP phosphoribosyltransferase
MKPLRIALTKGRLEKDSLGLFDAMGLDTAAVRDKGRRLILPVDPGGTGLPPIEVVLAKSADVITYVEHGVCDMGVVGKDTLLETLLERADAAERGFYEVLDLGFGRCRFALAAPADADFFGGHRQRTVASKFAAVARDYFDRKGMDVRVIKIEGSVELAPLLGLADGIVDIVETGSTLRENGLAVVEDITPVSARLIVNVAGMKLRKREIDALANAMKEALI